MFTEIAYLCIIIAVIFIVIAIYNIICFVLLHEYDNISKETAQRFIDSGSKLNIWKWIILHNNKIKQKVSNELAKEINSLIKKIKILLIIISISSIIISIFFINISIGIKQIGSQMNTVASALQSTFKDKECICYVECSGDEEDDTKSTYELLFGQREFKSFQALMELEPEDKEKWELLQSGTSSNESQVSTLGKEQNIFIINHINDNMVAKYKSIVASNNKFRSADGKDRSTMDDENIKKDMISLFSDYKQHGRNTECDCCKSASILKIKVKCIGEAKWKKGWTWAEIWGNDDDESNKGESGETGPIPGYKPGNATGQYAITLDDGMYYWFHQSTESCANNPTNPSYGSTGALRAGGQTSGNMQARGCSMYSSAIAVSNLLGMEVTPVDIINNVLGAVIQQKSDGTYYFETSSATVNGVHFENSVFSAKSVWAQNLINAYGSYGLKAKRINNVAIQSDVDEVLDKGGYIIASWNGETKWYKTGGSHFMVIRKKDSNGNYYCFTSCSSLYGGGHPGAVTSMNTGITFNELASRLNNADGVAMWVEGNTSSGNEGNITPPSSNITDTDIIEDIKNGKYTEEDYNYLVSLGGESSSYDGFYAVACSVRNRVRTSGGTYKSIITAPGQYAGHNNKEVGKPRNDNIKKAAVEVLRGSASTVGDCTYFFGRVNNYDMWAEANKCNGFFNIGNNIFYVPYGSVHNKKNNKTNDAIIIYEAATKIWKFTSGTKWFK